MSAPDDDLPDAPARRRALLEHESTLLVEAGAGSGKTALMAGRIALLLASGVPARDIVAISFTEASASELLERINRFVGNLNNGAIPLDLRLALPNGLSAGQASAIAAASETIDELTCTTIHGFCQQLLKPYPVEAHIDPGAVIIDPASADLAYQDLVQTWLSARFGRDRGDEGLGRNPSLPPRGEEDFFAELFFHEPDGVVKLIQEAADFLKTKRTSRVPAAELDSASITALTESIDAFVDWYAVCGLTEDETGAIIDELDRLKATIDEAMDGALTGRGLVQIFFHQHPDCRIASEPRFKNWGHKGRWEKAATASGLSKARGSQFSDAAKGHYERCSESYRSFVAAVANAAFARFVGEFKALASYTPTTSGRRRCLISTICFTIAAIFWPKTRLFAPLSASVIPASWSTNSRTPTPSRQKSSGDFAARERKRHTGPAEHCARAVCSLSATRNRRFTAFAVPMSIPISWRKKH